jgi:hypothetical protein
VVDSFAALTKNLMSFAVSCELPRLTGELEILVTGGNSGAIAFRLVASGTTILQKYKSITAALVGGDYKLAGEGIGEIVSIIFGFQI